MSYDMVSKYILRTYATDYIISGTDSEIYRSKQGDVMYSTEYSQDLWTKALSNGTVH